MTLIAELADELLDLKDDDKVRSWAMGLEVEDLDAVQAFVRTKEFQTYARNRAYRPIPHRWVAKRLGEFVWSKQHEIMASVMEHRYTAVPSCHGAGKSFIAARIVCHFLSCFPPGDAYVVTTAPTGDQVVNVLWREINKAHAKGNLVGSTGIKQWKIGKELVAIGRKPADTNPAAFQGIHARHLLVVIDEADGVAEAIFDAASDTLATNENGRVLAIGNPDRGQGSFFKACQPGSGWNVIRISAFSTPNFTGEKVPPRVAEMLVSRKWEQEKRLKWGPDDPRYRSKVLAEPPADNPKGVIPWSALVVSMAPRDDPWPEHALTPREAGVDVGASDGGDRTVVWARYGPKLVARHSFREADPEKAAGHLGRFLREHRIERVKIDVIGVGWAMAGFLEMQRKEGLHDAQVVRVNVANAGPMPSWSSEGFPRIRDQLWWEVGRGHALGNDGVPTWDLSVLSADEFEDVLPELYEPTWEPDAKGRIQVEPKDETKKRLKRSPDDADAILLAYYVPVVQGVAYGSTVAAARLS